MYNWLLGGQNNYAADRQVCAQLLQLAPGTRELARSNRRFLRRAVRFLVEHHGVRQFLDHGCGLPAQDNVHQIAQRAAPGARVVYIDQDPMVLAHGRTTLEENDQTLVLQEDIRETDRIFGHQDVRRLIDFHRPVAALFVSVLHCLPDPPDPARLVRHVARRLAPGSFVVMSQLTSDDAQLRAEMTKLMRRSVDDWGQVRERHETAACFTGMDLLPPGLVDVSTWRPDTAGVPPHKPRGWFEYGGIARIR